MLCVGVSRPLRLSPLIASLTAYDGEPGEPQPLGIRDIVEDRPGLLRDLLPYRRGRTRRQPDSRDGWARPGLVGRAAGKFSGVRIAARRLGVPLHVQKYLGFALQARAGLAPGLTLTVNSRYPEFAPTVTTVVLAQCGIRDDRGSQHTLRFAQGWRVGPGALDNRAGDGRVDSVELSTVRAGPSLKAADCREACVWPTAVG